MTLSKDIFILGDLNCNVLDTSDGNARPLLDFCLAFNLTQVIKQPTRCTDSSKTLIDVILVSNTLLVKSSGVQPVAISDHDLVFITLNLKSRRAKPVYVMRRSYKHYDASAFTRDIAEAPWSVIENFDDVDGKLNAFHLLFDPILEQHAPIRRVRLRTRPNPFVTDEIKLLMKTRDKWRKYASKTNDPDAWSSYRNLKREVKQRLRKAEREYVVKQIKDNPNDSNRLWKVIRSCIPKKDTSTKPFAKEEKIVANDFNDFFCSVGQNTVKEIRSLANEFNYDLNRSPFVPRRFPPADQFTFHAVTQEEVNQIILAMPLAKAPGVDRIHLKVIRDCLAHILTPLTSIINASFADELFPSRWKHAEIIPILKSSDRDRDLAENNRPISLLPILSKVCEKVALNQLMPYLLFHNRLTVNQSGNKQWHSTETSLIKTTDVILKAIDDKKLTAVVLLDMSKAFDSLDHDILISKLKDVGLSSEALNWFTSYLTDRYQSVRINSTLSEALKLESGVPQGSILGPLLFSIYVNDLPSITSKCSTESYVDDTKMYMCFSAKECNSSMMLINEDLERIRNWCFQNLLLINPSKTQLIVYGSRQMVAKLPECFQLFLLGKTLTPNESIKDLGVTFDRNLNFNEHIIKVSAQCMSALGQINRVKYVFDKELLITIINSLVFSKLFYCSSVWSTISEGNIKKLQSVQNFAARIIGGLRKYDHVIPILKELQWIPVKKYLFYRDAVLAFKCMNGLAPDYLSSLFTTRESVSRRTTRQSDQLNLPFFTSVKGQKSFKYRIAKLWNELSPDIKLCGSISAFKFNLKKELLRQFQLD